MEIYVLGSFQTRKDGATITPTAPKLRRMLALLAMDPNHVVSVDQIVEELWQDRPPSSAMTTLQTYVYQLRKLLGMDRRCSSNAARSGRDDAVLRTQPGGYLLSVDPDALDWYRFESLARQGHQYIQEGSLTTGVETLKTALDLWRGPVLGDVQPGPVLAAKIVRLEEMRKWVLEHRLDAELRLGRHNQLISELSFIATQQPTHEGFQAKLMIALYRAGRRTDALAVYQRARKSLDTDLGVEPSDGLQQIQRAILVGNLPQHSEPAEADAEQSEAAPPKARKPATKKTTAISTWENELKTVTEALAAHQPGALVIGGPGSGKTSFARKVVENVADHFPDGTHYLRLVQPDGSWTSADDMPHRLLECVMPRQRQPQTMEEAYAMFRRWAAEHKALLVLDDITHANQLRTVLYAESNCTVLAVSRCRIYHPALRGIVELGSIDATEATELLTTLVGSDRVARDTEGVRRLVQECDGSVLGLQAAAAKLRMRPHWLPCHLADRLSRDHRALDELAVGEIDIRASVRANLRMLPRHHHPNLRRLIHANITSLTPGTVSQLLDIDKLSAEEFLEELAELQLLEVTTPKQAADTHPPHSSTTFDYHLPTLIRRAIREVIDAELADDRDLVGDHDRELADEHLRLRSTGAAVRG